VRYENLLTRSFAILRRRPWLWLLALFAGETSSGGGGGGGSVNFQLTERQPVPDLSWLPQWLADRAGLIIEIALAVLVVSLAWFVVSCLASGALVGAVARIDAGEPMTFGAAWRIGVAAFRRVLALKLLLAVAVLVPALLLVIPPLAGSLGGTRGLLSGVLIDLPLLFALIYWAAFLGWFSQLALRACVLEQLGARPAVAAAWALLKRRFHRIAITTLVFIGAGIGIGILTSVLFALLEAPFLASLVAEVSQGRWAELPGTVLLWLAILSPVSLAISSLVGAYFAIAWTLAYRRFDVEGELAEPPPLAA
jgi:hypothetical protein